MGLEEITNNNNTSSKGSESQNQSHISYAGKVQGRSTTVIDESTSQEEKATPAVNSIKLVASQAFISSGSSSEEEEPKNLNNVKVLNRKISNVRQRTTNFIVNKITDINKIDIFQQTESQEIYKQKSDGNLHQLRENDVKEFDPTRDKYVILKQKPDGTIFATGSEELCQDLQKGRALLIDNENNPVDLDEFNVVADELLTHFHGVVQLAVNNYLLKLEKEDNKERDTEEEKAKSKHSQTSYNPNHVSPVKANDRLNITEDDQEKELKLFNRSQQQLLLQVLEAESVLESIHDKKVAEKKQLQKETLQQEVLHQEQSAEELHKSERKNSTEAA